MSMGRLLNAGLFYGGWFACVLGAAWGYPGVGLGLALVLLAIHLMTASHRGSEVVLVLTIGGLGFLVDTSQALAGVFQFAAGGTAAWLCPPWLVAIWMLFATTLNGSMHWLAGRYVVAAVLGAVGGPLSYAYGARLGAIPFVSENAITVLAVVWAVVMPLLLVINAAIKRRASAQSA